MNLTFKQLITKTMIALSAFTLFSGVEAQVEAAQKMPKNLIDARYNDARNRTVDFSMAQGYKKGTKVWYGGIVENDPNLVVTGDFTSLSVKKDAELYRYANDDRMINRVKLKQGNTVYLMPVKVNAMTQDAVNRNLLSDKKLNTEFLKLVNKERNRKGIKNLKYGAHLQGPADLRSIELAKYGHILVNGVAHRRPNGTSYITAFKTVKSNVIGENVALYAYDGNPYGLVSEKYIAEQLFLQWKNSPSHYQNMMDKRYSYTAISGKVGEIFPGHHHMNGVYGTQALSASN